MSLVGKRFYKVKKAKHRFLCALCSAPRELRYTKHLSLFNYIQLVILTAATLYFLFPYIGAKAAISFFIYWAGFELVNKFLYRKDLSCPYCGFDATWYKRDVKMARKKVELFWENHHSQIKPVESTESTEASETLN